MSADPQSSRTNGSLASCEDLLALFLEEHHEGRGDFEAFCARFPHEAEGLRALHARLAAIGELDPSSSPTHVDAPARLERVDEFELVAELGRGGMGIVYEARDRVLARRVAVKVMPSSRVGLGDARRRFEREIAALSRLSHPHLVAIYRSGLTHEPPYLAMELVRGGVSLEKRLDALRGVPLAARRAEHLLGDVRARPATRDALEATTDVDAPHAASATNGTHGSHAAHGTRATREREASYCGALARLLAETAEGLEHAHQNGVLHRDVKPANLLIDERGASRLVDFGVARLADEASLTATGGFAGTPLYAAPEQISSEHGELDGRTDVYALGVVLYLGLTGAAPYSLHEGADSREIFERIAREVPVEAARRAGGVPWELSVIAAKALEKRPERRYPSAGAFAADLRAWLAHRPIVARPPGIARRTWQGARRRPWLAAPALVAAAVLLVAVGLLARYAYQRYEAHAFHVRAPEVERDLSSRLAKLERANRRADELEAAAYLRPLQENERRERAALAAELAEGREFVQRILWPYFADYARHRERLTEAERADVLAALLGPGLEFAREAGSPELERDLQRLAEGDAPALAVGAKRQSFDLLVTPAHARVHLFRYVEERELAPLHWRSPRLYPVPCDLHGRALGYPAEAEWAPERTYPVDASDPASPRTLYPLFAVEQNTFALERLPRELPVASYLLWIRAEGHVDARVPLYLDARIPEHHPALAVALDRAGEVPAGFVRVEGGGFLSGGDRGRSYQAPQLAWSDIQPFYIAREELSFGAYLDVLRWKQERGVSIVQHLPRDRRNEEEPEPWHIDPRTLTITPPELAALPVCSIRFEDALAWCAYATERAEESGSSWIYELPWAFSWEKAARGADGRVFSWGHDFGWELCFGKLSERTKSETGGSRGAVPWMPVPSARCLGDESVYGVLALTGNVEEFVFREDRGHPQLSPGIKGGGLAREDAMSFRLPRFVSSLPEPSRGTGFRPVLRRREMPAQGPRGSRVLRLPFELSHD